jgi:hypothetical protein
MAKPTELKIVICSELVRPALSVVIPRAARKAKAWKLRLAAGSDHGHAGGAGAGEVLRDHTRGRRSTQGCQ